MVNPFADVNWNPDLPERRKFARTLCLGFLVIAFVVWLLAAIGWARPKPVLDSVLLGAAVLGGLLWIIPQIAKPFYLVWYLIGCCIGIVVSNLLLITFFYVVMTPVGLMMRAFGRDPLRRKWDPAARSYWEDAEKSVDPRRYFRQF